MKINGSTLVDHGKVKMPLDPRTRINPPLGSYDADISTRV